MWNEANLEVFWSGTPAEYLELYDVTAAAVRAVDERLLVGGPSSAAAGWVEELLAHASRTGSPVDFLTTHTYGSPPLDFRPMLERYGRHDVPIWWTEWGVTPTHFNEVSDAVFSGMFLLRGMASAMGRIEALSYWVVSDHFEELGRPPELLHGGFGLRTVGELRKPRWWALAMLERLGSRRLPLSPRPATAPGRWSRRSPRRPRTALTRSLLWNLTLDQSKAVGDPALAREVTVEVTGLTPGAAYSLTHERVDERALQRRGRVGLAPLGGPGVADRRAVGGVARGRPSRAARPGGVGHGRRVGCGAGDDHHADAVDEPVDPGSLTGRRHDPDTAAGPRRDAGALLTVWGE